MPGMGYETEHGGSVRTGVRFFPTARWRITVHNSTPECLLSCLLVHGSVFAPRYLTGWLHSPKKYIGCGIPAPVERVVYGVKYGGAPWTREGKHEPGSCPSPASPQVPDQKRPPLCAWYRARLTRKLTLCSCAPRKQPKPSRLFDMPVGCAFAPDSEYPRTPAATVPCHSALSLTGGPVACRVPHVSIARGGIR